MACARDERPGTKGTARHRVHKPQRSGPTCAARRRDARASAPARVPHRPPRTETGPRALAWSCRSRALTVSPVIAPLCFTLVNHEIRDLRMAKRIVDVLVPVALD